MRRPRQLGVRGDRLQQRGPGEGLAVSFRGGKQRQVDQRRHLGRGIELIFAVETEPGYDHELALAVEIEADPFGAEPQPQAQRYFEPHERDAVLAEDRVQALRSGREDVGERGEARFVILRGCARAVRRRGVDGRAEIAPRADARRHRHDRVLREIVVLVHRRPYAPFHVARRGRCTAWN